MHHVDHQCPFGPIILMIISHYLPAVYDYSDSLENRQLFPNISFHWTFRDNKPCSDDNTIWVHSQTTDKQDSWLIKVKPFSSMKSIGTESVYMLLTIKTLAFLDSRTMFESYNETMVYISRSLKIIQCMVNQLI